MRYRQELIVSLIMMLAAQVEFSFEEERKRFAEGSGSSTRSL